jgi:excisionase family DNA binding protein
MKQMKQGGHEIAPMLSTPAVAKRLGVSPQTVRRLIWSKELPALQSGKHYRVSEADLVAFIEAHKTR